MVSIAAIVKEPNGVVIGVTLIRVSGWGLILKFIFYLFTHVRQKLIQMKYILISMGYTIIQSRLSSGKILQVRQGECL